jgi:hypothetical protein
MGVHHHGRHVPVPQQLLHRPDVVPILQQMGRKRVPQAVAGRPFGYPRHVNGSLDRPLDHRFVQVMPAAEAARRIYVSDEVVQIVRGMDGYNRFRFTAEPNLLAAWTAACNVIGPPKAGGEADGRTDTPSGTPPGAGQIKPAA